MKYKKHRHGRNVRDFEAHSMARSGKNARGRAAWRFYDPSRVWFNPMEPHFRKTVRTPALPGNHLRSVEEPAKAAHGKTL